jgi:hypothetical protein
MPTQDGHGDYVTVQTSVTVNLQQWRIQIFEVWSLDTWHSQPDVEGFRKVQKK